MVINLHLYGALWFSEQLYKLFFFILFFPFTVMPGKVGQRFSDSVFRIKKKKKVQNGEVTSLRLKLRLALGHLTLGLVIFQQ